MIYLSYFEITFFSAYETLGDEKKRSMYDQTGMSGDDA